MISIALKALELVGGGVVKYFQAGADRKKIKIESDAKIFEAKTTAKIKRIESGDNAAINMDAMSIDGRGWKDEYLLLIVTVPLILCFIPSMVAYVAAGFVALENVPEWYRWLLLGVFIDTFGFRRIMRNVLETYLQKRFG